VLTQYRTALTPLAWTLAILALCLSVTGWFTIFGLVIAIPAMVVARAGGVRGAFIIAVAAAGITALWLLIGLVVA
jgi:hypothetical protein